jgi:hypothetical protein
MANKNATQRRYEILESYKDVFSQATSFRLTEDQISQKIKGVEDRKKIRLLPAYQQWFLKGWLEARFECLAAIMLHYTEWNGKWWLSKDFDPEQHCTTWSAMDAIGYKTGYMWPLRPNEIDVGERKPYLIYDTRPDRIEAR